jgi:hypothetical protein
MCYWGITDQAVMMIAVAHSIVLLALAYLISKKELPSLKKVFWPALGLKLFSGVALGLLYTYYYTVSDTFAYFEDACKISQLLRQDAGEYFRFLWQSDETFSLWSQLHYQQPRALFLSKVVSFFCLLTQDNYWVAALYLSFISFLGIWRLIKYISAHYPGIKSVAIFAFLFFPSIVFWTSGIIKESLAMAALCFVVLIFMKLYRADKVKITEWIPLLVSIWLLWNLKYYYLAILIPVASTTLVMKLIVCPRVKFQHVAFEMLAWLGIFVIPLALVSRVHPNFYPDRFLTVIVENYTLYQAKSDPGNMIVFEDLRATPIAVLKNVPEAFFSSLFRPFLWEAGTLLQLLVAAENVVLLLLTLFTLRNCSKLFQSPDRLILFAMLVYVVLLGSFLALSTPNFGTLARYRTGFLPFFILLVTIENPLFTGISSFIERTFSGLVRTRT